LSDITWADCLEKLADGVAVSVSTIAGGVEDISSLASGLDADVKGETARGGNT
jgi:hypothetical protein